MIRLIDDHSDSKLEWKSRMIVHIITSNAQLVTSKFINIPELHKLVLHTHFQHEPTPIFAALVPHCQYLGFLELDCRNSIDGTEIECLAKILESVQFLIINALVIHDIGKLTNAFVNLHQVKIDVESCNQGLVAHILKSRVENVILIKLRSVEFVADAIATSKYLVKLCIQNSFLSKQDVHALINSIVRNKTIRELECDNFAGLIMSNLANQLSEIRIHKLDKLVINDNLKYVTYAISCDFLTKIMCSNRNLTCLEICLDIMIVNFQQLAEIIRHNSSLRKLRINLVKLMEPEYSYSIGCYDLKRVVDSLAYNQSLEELALDCEISLEIYNGEDVLSGLKFNTNLRKIQIFSSLCFMNNTKLALNLTDLIRQSRLEAIGVKVEVTEDTFIKLMQALKHNQTIQILTLVLNKLTDAMCQALVHMFQHNNCIRNFYFSCRYGLGNVFTFLDQNQSLRKINLWAISHEDIYGHRMSMHFPSYILFDKPHAYTYTKDLFNHNSENYLVLNSGFTDANCRCAFCGGTREVENINQALSSNYTLEKFVMGKDVVFINGTLRNLNRRRGRMSLMNLAADVGRKNIALPPKHLIPDEVWSKLVE